MPREVTHRYIDPLAQVWIGAAKRIGLRVVRTADAYAATDGNGTLAIGTDDVLDGDDSLAQMIFHELCHSLVEGEDSFARADWGMDNTGPDHDWREHACLRTQWVLAGRHGLRAVFAPTTDFRTTFWNTLSGDVLADRTDPSVQAAITAIRRAALPPWAPALEDALVASSKIAVEAARYVPDPTSLWKLATPPPDRHPTGLPMGTAGTCGTCIWRVDAGRDPFVTRAIAQPTDARPRCRQIDGRVDVAWPACERYEAALDCQTCGACCRAAYHSVEVGPRDPVRKARPDYVIDRGTYLEIRREGDRCAALHGGERVHLPVVTSQAIAQSRSIAQTTTPYHCVIYEDRPRTCRDFTLGSAHCLTARRRVGLSL